MTSLSQFRLLKAFPFIAATACFTNSWASSEERRPEAVVLSVNGSACVKTLEKCDGLKAGDYIFDFDRIQVDENAVSLYSFSQQQKIRLLSGTHTIRSLATNEPAELKKTANLLLKLNKRATASASMRGSQTTCTLNSSFSTSTGWLENCIEEKTVSAENMTEKALLLPQFSFYRTIPQTLIRPKSDFLLATHNSCTKDKTIYLKALNEAWNSGESFYVISSIDGERLVYGLRRISSKCEMERLNESQIIKNATFLSRIEKANAFQQIYIDYGLLFEASNSEQLLSEAE